MATRVLTIAGSDSSGGAGIQADLKTFTVFGVYGMTAITAVTAQHTGGVARVEVLAPAMVRAQIDAVVEDIGIDAVKTGMLATGEIVRTVAERVQALQLMPLVVDPVMVAHSGARLLDPEGCYALKHFLLPWASLVTPNIPEAEAITGLRIDSRSDMTRAAERIVALGAKACLVKGGHSQTASAEDVLFDGLSFQFFVSPRRTTRHTHGTGCQLSAAITAGLAQGLELAEAVARAKEFIDRAIDHGLPLGRGHGPANPLAWLMRTPN